jgi:hypothetical protein
MTIYRHRMRRLAAADAGDATSIDVHFLSMSMKLQFLGWSSRHERPRSKKWCPVVVMGHEPVCLHLKFFEKYALFMAFHRGRKCLHSIGILPEICSSRGLNIVPAHVLWGGREKISAINNALRHLIVGIQLFP